MVKDILRAAQEIKNVLLKLSNQPTKEPDPWLTILMGMVGTCYSLQKAERLLNAYRDFQLLVDQAKDLLNHIERDINNLAIESDLKSWFVGYYLNNAELRISSVLHRLLKVFNNKEENAQNLIEMTRKECPHCHGKPNQCYPKTKSILDEYKRHEEKLTSFGYDYSDRSQGACIRRIWHRVNKLKHYPLPLPDKESPTERWKDVYRGLCGLLHVFDEFAVHKGVLK